MHLICPKLGLNQQTSSCGPIVQQHFLVVRPIYSSQTMVKQAKSLSTASTYRCLEMCEYAIQLSILVYSRPDQTRPGQGRPAPSANPRRTPPDALAVKVCEQSRRLTLELLCAREHSPAPSLAPAWPSSKATSPSHSLSLSHSLPPYYQHGATRLKAKD